VQSYVSTAKAECNRVTAMLISRYSGKITYSTVQNLEQQIIDVLPCLLKLK